MSSLASKFANQFTSSARRIVLVSGAQRVSKLSYSTVSSDDDNDGGKNNFDDDKDGGKNRAAEDLHEDFRREAIPQGVDPKRGYNFRGVHKAIICGKISQTPVQKLLRNGRTLTIFNVGTGGMWDNRTFNAKDLPRPAQWHRVVVHNEPLGAYAVQQLVKNSSVYVEGEIELRVYNRGITGETVKMPEICVRRDGKIRLMKSGESPTSIPFDELRKGLM